MKRIVNNRNWENRQFAVSTTVGLLLLIVSLVINYFASLYAAKQASNAVTDILLNNLPVVNTDLVFIQGAVIFLAFTIYTLFTKTKRIPFVLKGIALFIFVRSVFISLTHIAPFPFRADVAKDSIINFFTLGSDLFFSGHTGLPFLLSLIFWQNKSLRIIFLMFSLIFAASVLLGHLHYSIDVFAAYFITYTIYHLAIYLFKNDYKIFKELNLPD